MKIKVEYVVKATKEIEVNDIFETLKYGYNDRLADRLLTVIENEVQGEVTEVKTTNGLDLWGVL